MKSKQDAYYEDKLRAQDSAIDPILQANDTEEEYDGMDYYDSIGMGIDLSNINSEEDVISASQKAAKNYADKQAELQNESTKLSVESLKQEKEELEKEYRKEQSAAYKDYQKAIDPYGTQAEQLAASGLSNSGYSESAKMQAYVAYQNRVTVMKESYIKAEANYKTAIQEAKLSNNSALAQIAYQNFQAQLELILSKFQSGEYEFSSGGGTQSGTQSGTITTTPQATQSATQNEQNGDATEWQYLASGLKNTADITKKAIDKFQQFAPSGRVQTLIQSAKDVKLDSPESIEKFLRANMISAPKALTRKEWMREKQNGNTDPQYQFDSYAKYLGEYMLACIWTYAENPQLFLE